MALNERDVSFFRPLWIRVLVTAVLAAWCAGELIFTHDQLWIGVTAFGLAYCVYNFFWKFPKQAATPAAPPAEPAPLPERASPPAKDADTAEP